mmetsp:Transcript_8785/g.16768  ORF Transcript_8785/g.16768 Transcript_8785/m.16768 type:complete len:243 (+) Transcript_8785:119-847(+)|eukprot:scaffold516_cov175-Amphora_coffeaeformis.AAC.5
MFNSEVIPTVLKNYNSSIAEPTKADVLCGKDTTLARHPGNQRFREKIQTELPRYLQARSKQEKMKITKSIVQYITVKLGSRFLKSKPDGKWVEIDGQAARDKVSHALRFAARQQKKTTDNEHSDDNSSQGSTDETSSITSASAPVPPPMPSRHEMERNTTNVEELFAAFEQTLAGPEIDEPLEHGRQIRRESSHLLLSFLASVDFDEYDLQAEIDDQERQFLSMGAEGFHQEHHAVTQWAAC